MNSDLKRERSNATFNVEKITNVLDGGRHKTERRRFLEAVIERDPTGIFSNEDNNYLHRTDRHKNGMAKGVRLIEICRKLGIGNECEGRITESKDFPVILEAVADDIPLGTFCFCGSVADFELCVHNELLTRIVLSNYSISSALGHVPAQHCEFVRRGTTGAVASPL